MPRRIDLVLREIIATIDGLDMALVGTTRPRFATDWFMQRGAERGIEIISEAVRHLPDEILATQPHIDWSDVRAIGNIIRHEYHRVDPDVIWSVIQDDLPGLRAAIASMLASLPKPS